MSDKPEFPPELVERCVLASLAAKSNGQYRVIVEAVLRESGHAELVAALQWILSANAGVSDADYRALAMQFARDALRKAGPAQ